ncbi:MAG: hypothetical protein ACXW18_04390 [Pyrinomonadaceae bacterium]
MMSSRPSGKALYDNLDTTFVNLWSLLRNLTERGFIGRVHVELEDYSADVFLTGSSTPLVHEIDQAAGTETLEEAALHRLVLRARGAPGKISVFEGSAEAVAVENPTASSQSQTIVEAKLDEPESPVSDLSSPAAPALESSIETDYGDETVTRVQAPEPSSSVPSDIGLEAIVSLSGELIGAVERGITASGEDFGSLFNAIRLELADDYGFLDPMSNKFSYANGSASLAQDVTPGVYVSGLSEALRRAVDRVAVGDRARRVRERIALELLGVARKRKDILENSGFRLQLDRIAGTKVI